MNLVVRDIIKKILTARQSTITKCAIKDVIEMSEGRIILDVEHLSSSRRIGLFSDRHFIPLDVYREFQLKKVLDF
jgi:hypothetical protein